MHAQTLLTLKFLQRQGKSNNNMYRFASRCKLSTYDISLILIRQQDCVSQKRSQGNLLRLQRPLFRASLSSKLCRKLQGLVNTSPQTVQASKLVDITYHSTNRRLHERSKLVHPVWAFVELC